MIRQFSVLLALCVLLLSGCGQEDGTTRPATPSPAVWKVERAGRTAWLFGTIHVLPDGVVWQSAALEQAVSQSDQLILEIANLSDSRTLQATFERLGRSPGLPPLASRLPPKTLPVLQHSLAGSPYTIASLTAYESWAAALLISSIQRTAIGVTPAQGVEETLGTWFRKDGKPVLGLETPASQLASFDTLSPDAQRALLVQTVQSAPEAKRLFRELFEAWRDGDTVRLARALESQMGNQAELRNTVLTQRNANWADQIDALMKTGGTGRPLIAVGAAHLVGPGNLIDMLASKGFRVTRAE